MFTLGAIFWILYLVGFIFTGYRNRAGFGEWFMDSLLFWVLIGLLGLGAFGGPVK